ncbi:MAG: hypothetical protein V7711_13255 [Pseudomonadales bacterium]
MRSTLVLQSHTDPLPHRWLSECIGSVKAWAELKCFDYRFIGDELFQSLEADVLEKTASQRVVATDIARLDALIGALHEGYDNVVWCDADFLIFNPAELAMPDSHYALGREVWVQTDVKNSKLKARVKVHNAFMVFSQGNSFLDFYRDAALRLVRLNVGPMPPQFVGPKLLTALHNVVQCPVVEAAGMLSPLVINDICCGGGPALELFVRRSQLPLAGANLCSSLVNGAELDDDMIGQAIDRLLDEGGHIFLP